jgi:hypothetical protein
MCSNGTGATSGYDRTVVNVVFGFLDEEDSYPGRGLAVEVDLADGGVGGLETRFGLAVGPSTLVSSDDAGPAGMIVDELAMAFGCSCMMFEMGIGDRSGLCTI